MKRGFLLEKGKKKQDGLGSSSEEVRRNNSFAPMFQSPDRVGQPAWNARGSSWIRQSPHVPTSPYEPWTTTTADATPSRTETKQRAVDTKMEDAQTVSTTDTIKSVISTSSGNTCVSEISTASMQRATCGSGSTASSPLHVHSPKQPQGILDARDPYEGQPLLPSGFTIHVPKACLASWYGQKPRSHQLSKESYITWNDGSMPHKLKFTCLFVCPLTAEVFCSGTYGKDTSVYEVRTDPNTGADVVWYKKKTLAEHGAAARAYDCFSYRQYFGTSTRSVHIGTSPVYLESSSCARLDPEHPPPSSLPTLPSHVSVSMLSLQQQAQERMKLREWNGGVEILFAAEAERTRKLEAAAREEYRQARTAMQVETEEGGHLVETVEEGDE